jgi:carboxylesterase
MPGAEPFELPGRPDVGVLLIHGYTGSPYEMRPVGEALSRHGIGSLGLLLRGHGTHPDDMLGRTYTDWIADVEEGLDRVLERHERAAIVGLSMGGTLTLNVASRHASDPRLAGLVTIGAPLRLHDWRLGIAGLLSRLVTWQAWGQPDIKDRRAWERHVAYRRFRTRTILELLALMRETTGRLSLVRQPILVVQARADHVVPALNAQLIRDGVSSPDRTVLLLDNCYHVITVDFPADRLNAEIVRFVQRLGSFDGPAPDLPDGRSS